MKKERSSSSSEASGPSWGLSGLLKAAITSAQKVLGDKTGDL